MSSPSDENDCPFVLELEIDDEISFKPLAKKAPTSSSSAQNRVLQPLNENKLTNYPPPKTPGALEKVKPCTPRTIKLRTVEKRELDQGRDFGAPPSTQTSPRTTKATPLREDSRPALKIPPFPPLSFQDQLDLTANILPPNLQQFKRSFLDPDDNSQEKSSARFINCSNLISSCSSFLAEGSSGSGGRRQSFLSSGDAYHRQESPDAEELLQKKVDDLEVRNAELSQEKVVLETQISELIASSSSRTEAAAGELSHADIQVKALTEQLERSKQHADLLVTEHTLELTNLRNTYEKRLTEIITSNAQAVIDAQGRISREMAQKWDKLYAEEQGKVQDLTASLESANEKLAAAEEEMTRVAYETKKKAYEKVKAQFDSGNKEFQKLKSSLREVVLEKEKSERKATQQEALVVELRAEVQSLKDGHQGLRSQLSEIETILKTIPLTFEAGAGAAVKDQLIALRAAFEAKLLEHQQTVTSWESRTIDLKSQISSLESTLKGCQGEKALLETQLGKVQQEAKLSAEAAESLRGELTGLKHERDSQLLAIGNVLQEKHQLEEELQRKAGEVGELVSRCEGLRQMNEEIVCMLEKVYQQQPQEGGA